MQLRRILQFVCFGFHLLRPLKRTRNIIKVPCGSKNIAHILCDCAPSVHSCPCIYIPGVSETRILDCKLYFVFNLSLMCLGYVVLLMTEC